MAELLSAALADVLPQSGVSSHTWASAGDQHVRILDRVRDVWAEQFGVPQSAGRRSAEDLLQELKCVESPTATANVPVRQVGPCSMLEYKADHLIINTSSIMNRNVTTKEV